jgi:hypothetical protein
MMETNLLNEIFRDPLIKTVIEMEWFGTFRDPLTSTVSVVISELPVVSINVEKLNKPVQIKIFR